MLRDLIYKKFKDKKVLILGFGKEGRSTYRALREILPSQLLTIADKENIPYSDPIFPDKDKNVKLITGEHYLDKTDEFDYIFKSPGVYLNRPEKVFDRSKLTSQTDMFLNTFSGQIIGITGTKGKSTTASLVFHIMKQHTGKVLLCGNIGIPPFEVMSEIDKNSIIILELSAHQLEYLTASPKTAVILNIFPEHLDYYSSFENYCNAKANITNFQNSFENLILPKDESIIGEILKPKLTDRNLYEYSLHANVDKGCYLEGNTVIFSTGTEKKDIISIESKMPLRGAHNLLNIMAAINVCMIFKIPVDLISKGIKTFKPLEHRLEYAGEYNGVNYYNDSISTIPQSTIQALRSIKDVTTVIIGGYDRGIDYDELIHFLQDSDLKNIILLGDVGKRLYESIKDRPKISKRSLYAAGLAEAVAFAAKLTIKGSSCLFSPAAASYDAFKNFEERGNTFKKLIKIADHYQLQ